MSELMKQQLSKHGPSGKEPQGSRFTRTSKGTAPTNNSDHFKMY